MDKWEPYTIACYTDNGYKVVGPSGYREADFVTELEAEFYCLARNEAANHAGTTDVLAAIGFIKLERE